MNQLEKHHRMTSATQARGARGFGLIEALIAMAILSFGLLGLTRMQGNLSEQTSTSQTRAAATRLADEYLSTVLVDLPNAGCYTVPLPQASCTSETAKTIASNWAGRVESLGGFNVLTVSISPDNQQMTVVIRWNGKGENDGDYIVSMTTDIRINAP